MSIIESIIKNIFFREKKHLAMSYEKEINRCIGVAIGGGGLRVRIRRRQCTGPKLHPP